MHDVLIILDEINQISLIKILSEFQARQKLALYRRSLK